MLFGEFDIARAFSALISTPALLYFHRLCIDIPMAGARLLESGVEQFLTLKVTGKLGPGEMDHAKQK